MALSSLRAMPFQMLLEGLQEQIVTKSKPPKPFARTENLVPKVGIEPTRGVSPTGF